MRIPGSNLIEGEKYIFLFILLNKMHITFYQKQSHGEHDILALLHFSCAISCNIRVFKYNHIWSSTSEMTLPTRERDKREREKKNIHKIDQNQIIKYDRE